MQEINIEFLAIIGSMEPAIERLSEGAGYEYFDFWPGMPAGTLSPVRGRFFPLLLEIRCLNPNNRDAAGNKLQARSCGRGFF